jgi:CheY-like chemotaxis protein
VLLVEDNAINIKVFDNFLKKFGCDFDVAVNGQEAIEKINENKYDVVFMDVQMPVMGGIEAIELIRKDVDKDIPVIALTAAAMKGDYEQCIASGMNDYLSKPVRYDKLKEVLQKWACGVS